MTERECPAASTCAPVIRRGTDILTALALGARAVLIGHAYLYGLAAGTPGVAHAFDSAPTSTNRLALTGAATLEDLDSGLVRDWPDANQSQFTLLQARKVPVVQLAHSALHNKNLPPVVVGALIRLPDQAREGTT